MAKFLFFLLSLLTCLTINAQSDLETFLLNNTKSIQLNDTTSFSDLAFLDTLLKDKKIVLLGEFNHGAKEIFLLKNRLIKYLHEKHGFNLILMESGVGEMLLMNDTKDSLSANQLVYSGLMGPWRTEEFSVLMRYYKSTEGLYFGGYDSQKTGSSFSEVLPNILQYLDVEIAEKAMALEKDNNAFIKSMKKNSLDTLMTKDFEKLIEEYKSLEFYIEEREQALSNLGVDKKLVGLILQTIKNRIWYLDYYYAFKKDNDWTKRFAARDSAMAMNVEFFLESLFPKEKVIICGHNYHISKFNEKQLTMGEKLFEKYGDKMYTIGFFGGNGSYASNSRKIKQIETPTEENDLRKIMLHSANEISFLGFQNIDQVGSEWLDNEVLVSDSFIDLSKGKTIDLKHTFDALIFIKKVSPPVYLQR